jgi:phage-related protein
MFRVSFYTPARKVSPVKEFLDSCQSRLRVKILRQLQYIQEFGLSPVIPNLKKIKNTPLWELRILGKDNVRIICASFSQKEIKVIHVFRKKKRKMPLKELNLALKRYQEMLDS